MISKIDRSRLEALSVSVFGNNNQWKRMSKQVTEVVYPKHVTKVHKNGKKQVLTIEKAVELGLHDGQIKPVEVTKDVVLTPNEALIYLYTANCAKAVNFWYSNDDYKNKAVIALALLSGATCKPWYPFLDTVFTDYEGVDISGLPETLQKSIKECRISADNRVKSFAFTRYMTVSLADFIKEYNTLSETKEEKEKEFYQAVFNVTGAL